MKQDIVCKSSENVILEKFKEPLWENTKRFTVLQGGG